MREGAGKRVVIKRLAWLILWIVILLGMAWTAFRADEAFGEYMAFGHPSIRDAVMLLPLDVKVVAYDAQFSADWATFRKSTVFSTLHGLVSFHDLFLEWNLPETEAGALEKWLTSYWGPEIVAAYSSERHALYVVSPIGSRGKCIEWLFGMYLSPFKGRIEWKWGKDGEYRYLDVRETAFLPAGYHMQIYPVKGVAVLAISPDSNPMHEVVEVLESPDRSLGGVASFQDFLEAAIAHPGTLSGFLRRKDDARELGMRWRLTLNSKGDVEIDLSIPSTTVTPTTLSTLAESNLEMFRLPDDVMDVTVHRQDAQIYWAELIKALPQEWTVPVKSWDAKNLLGSYRELWRPVWEGIGNEFFVGIGPSAQISDRFKISVPRLVMAVPYHDTATFIRAMEGTILRLNKEEGADLVIRKKRLSHVDYYEIKQSDSAWSKKHGLKSLPVFAFIHGWMVMAPNSSTMERIIEEAGSPEVSHTPLPSGLNVRMDFRNSTHTLKTLLGLLGALNEKNDNVYLSREGTLLLGQAFALMEQFGKSSLNITSTSGEIHVHASLGP